MNPKLTIMNRTKHIIFLLNFFISFGVADIASPTPFKALQPNGYEFEILNRGNHLQGWHEFNGWTIVQNSDDWWVYASGNNGIELIPSNIRVGLTLSTMGLFLILKKGSALRLEFYRIILLFPIFIQPEPTHFTSR